MKLRDCLKQLERANIIEDSDTGAILKMTKVRLSGNTTEDEARFSACVFVNQSTSETFTLRLEDEVEAVNNNLTTVVDGKTIKLAFFEVKRISLMRVRDCLKWFREADTVFEFNTQKDFRISLQDELGNSGVDDEAVAVVRFDNDAYCEEFELHLDTEVEINDNEILVNVDGEEMRLTLQKTSIIELV